MRSLFDVNKMLTDLMLYEVPDDGLLEQSNLSSVFRVLIEEPPFEKTFVLPHFNFRFVMAPLREYEQRIIAQKLSNYDQTTKEILKRVEVLTYAIMAIEAPADADKFVPYKFIDIHEKMKLRNVLLALPPIIIEYLYTAYQQVEAEYNERIRKMLGGTPQEVLARSFFQEIVDNSKKPRV